MSPPCHLLADREHCYEQARVGYEAHRTDWAFLVSREMVARVSP
ncbi:hypothetical protein [Neorhodopirellula pilleata]|nr:hypothetical protein [Neorhodopirellula pilleata]